jgi:cell division septum initiation protein DivIVA
VRGGVSVEAVNKIRQIVQDKTEKLQKLGDEAWKKGLEQAKPYLDKNPQVKELIEKNAESLKQGNIGEIFEKVKDAVSSGKTDDLQEYVKKAGEAAKNSGFGQQVEQYAKKLPGGSEIWPKLQKLQQVAQSRGDEAEKILKGAYKDVAEVLQKRTEEAEKLAKEAGEDAKKESKK